MQELTPRRSNKEHQRVNKRHQHFNFNTRVNGEATVRRLSYLLPWLIHKLDQKRHRKQKMGVLYHL